MEFKITSDVALRGALDAIAMMEMPRSREPESTRSKIKARAQMGAVDRVSEIARWRLIAISAIVCDTWTHQGLSITIGWAINVGSWDRGPRSSRDRGRRSVFTESDGPHFSRGISF